MSNPNGQLSIRTNGSSDELMQLMDWFRHDEFLRGQVQPRPLQVSDDRMGDLYDVLMVAAGAGGLAPALARSLTTWLTLRRSEITLTVTRDADGVAIEVDAERVKTTDLVKEIQKLIDPPETRCDSPT